MESKPGMDKLGSDRIDTDRDRPISDRLGPDRYSRFDSIGLKEVDCVGPIQVDFESVGPIGLDRLNRHAYKIKFIA